MLIRNFDLNKLADSVWDNGDYENETNDPITEIAKRLDFWQVAGLKKPDKKEQK